MLRALVELADALGSHCGGKASEVEFSLPHSWAMQLSEHGGGIRLSSSTFLSLFRDGTIAIITVLGGCPTDRFTAMFFLEGIKIGLGL